MPPVMSVSCVGRLRATCMHTAPSRRTCRTPASSARAAASRGGAGQAERAVRLHAAAAWSASAARPSRRPWRPAQVNAEGAGGEQEGGAEGETAQIPEEWMRDAAVAGLREAKVRVAAARRPPLLWFHEWWEPW
jgi:hypothetical protein